MSPATAADIESVVGIARATFDWHHETAPNEYATFNLAAVRKSMRKARSARGSSLMVARDGSEIVGFVHFFIIHYGGSLGLAARSFGFVEHIAVRCDRRREGIGHALMEVVRDHMRRESIATLSATVLEANSASVAFFEKEGFGTFTRTWISRASATATA